MIEMSSDGVRPSSGLRPKSGVRPSRPMTVQLYSRAVSSRLSADPLCLYFYYFIHGGVDGQLTISTLNNAGNSTVQWIVHGHLMNSWQFSFVQINTRGGPFQVLHSHKLHTIG